MWSPLIPVWTKPAAKQLAKLPAKIQAQIEAAVNRYAVTGVGDIKVLSGKLAGQPRLRSGDYRVKFEILVVDRQLVILAVDDRKNIYN